MSKVRRTLAAALTLIMLATCSPIVFAEEAADTNATAVAPKGALSDVTTDQLYYDAVKTLNVMGIINGYEDGTFKPSQNVTRAEFTAMLMRTLKLGSIGSKSAAGLPFKDVDDNNSDINWAIPDINTAFAKGAINGYEDGTFRPTANVAYEEAIKMIVCTLGYTADASVTPWYSGYISTATQRGITKTAAKLGAPETPATRACIAQLLYDSLEVYLVENDELTDKTILSDYLGYNKCTGVIHSNGVTSLDSPDVRLRDNEVQIYAQDEDSSSYELHTYTTDDATINNYLGHEVEFYYIDNGSNNRTLMFSVIVGEEPIVINAASVELSESDDTSIEYYENMDDRSTKSIRLEDDNVVVYNGKLYGASASASNFDIDMVPSLGQLKFVDSDGNNRYDVIEITAYDAYYVSSKSSSTYEIIDNVIQPAEKKTLKLDTDADSNLSIVNKSGNEIQFSSIANGNIVCVAKSNSGNGAKVTTKAIVVTDKVTGAITAVNDDKITIGSKDYRVSNAAPWITGSNSKLEAPMNQDSGVYNLDLNGDIVAYSKNATATNIEYGYIVAYSIDDESFDGDVSLRILNSTGKTVYLGTNRSTKVDGQTCSTGQSVVDALAEGADNGESGVAAVQQLVKYTTKTVSGKTVVDQFYTADPAPAGKVEAAKLNMLETVSRDKQPTFDATAKTLTIGGAKINVSGAVIIAVPDSGEYDDFKKTTTTAFRGSYGIEAYDASSTNVPKVILLYGGTGVSGIEDATPVRILDSISEAKNDNENGEVMNRVSGFSSSTGVAKGKFENEWISNDSNSSYVSALQKGDIFRAAKDDEGYLLLKDDENRINYTDFLYQVGEDNKFGEFGSLTESSYYGGMLGSIIAVDDDSKSISVAPEKVAKGGTYNEADLHLFNLSDFADAYVLVYDNTGEELKIIEGEYEAAIMGLNAHSEGLEPSKVLIYKVRGKIKLICVLPE